MSRNLDFILDFHARDYTKTLTAQNLLLSTQAHPYLLRRRVLRYTFSFLVMTSQDGRGRRRRRRSKMSRSIYKTMLMSVLAVVCLLPASSCCFSSLGNLVLASIDWFMGPNASQDLKFNEPICSCALVTESCPLYILHDAPEPYCPSYTRYCCELEPIAALLQPRNVTTGGIWASRTALARRGMVARVVESCKCTSNLLPCSVQIYSTGHSSSELFDCSFLYRFCCDRKVLRDAILPFVANPNQESPEEDIQGQQEPQDVGNEEKEDPGTQASGSWWSIPSWVW